MPTARKPKTPSCSSWFIYVVAVLAAGGLCTSPACAMDITQQGTKLIVTGANFRYTWDTRRGGEMTSVEQPGLAAGGWWNRGQAETPTSNWQRVNSTFAWKSLDTIPSLSFSTKRGAYYSGEWNIAYANADRHATLKIISKSPTELVFETHSNPRILENQRLNIPWKVTQQVRVFDSGLVLTHLDIRLPKDETYELDWASLSINLDDSLYKEPHPDRQERFAFGWAFPGDRDISWGFDKPVLQDLPHLPLDIDLKIEKTKITEKPILFGAAAYDLTHVKSAVQDGFAEWCLENANSLVGTKEDFGSYLMVRPQSGMSHVPTDVGSMRGSPCMSAGWNLFDGKTQGLNEPLGYTNTLAFAVGSRKRSSLPTAPADDRNVLLGARIYYAKDKLPTEADIKTMAAEGCDTLILGSAWRTDEPAAIAAVKAAHASGMRAGGEVDARNMKSLVTDSAWFTRVFEKDRDGLLVTNASFLANTINQDEFTLDGEPISFKTDGPFRANAASLALCMRKLRQTVGTGFLISEDTPPTLLALAECDLHASTAPRPRSDPADFAPITASLTPQQITEAAIHADTPILLWPPSDKQHLAWWQQLQKLPKTFRIESDLYPAERRFTTSNENVHGTLFDSGDGHMTLLLAAEKTASNVTVTFNGAPIKAGDFTANQVKSIPLPAPKESAK
jgi:hypothetical protein